MIIPAKGDAVTTIVETRTFSDTGLNKGLTVAETLQPGVRGIITGVHSNVAGDGRILSVSFEVGIRFVHESCLKVIK